MHIGNNDKVRLEWDFDTFTTMCIIDVSFFLVIIQLNLLCPSCGTAITYLFRIVTGVNCNESTIFCTNGRSESNCDGEFSYCIK